MTHNQINNRQDQALDQLLDLSPPAPASPQLAQHILAAANASNGPASNVVEFTPKRRSAKPPYLKPDNWLIGGLMAASLIIGIWSGTSDISDLLVTAPLELAGIEQPSEFDTYPVLSGFSATESLL